jgi:hypothetical protein
MPCRHMRIEADRILNLEQLAKTESIASICAELGSGLDE